MARSGWKTAALFTGLAATTGLAGHANATELKPETSAAFERYVRTREAQLEENAQKGNILYSETLPEAVGSALEVDLRQGKIYILEVTTISPSQPMHVSHGLIHDWLGMAFIRGATAAQVNALLEDFDREETIYKPDIRRSRLLESDGDQYKISLQFYTKAIITVVLNGNFDVKYRTLSDTRAESRSYSTRFAEVEDAGKPGEHEVPPENEHGYMWRMNSYWRIEQRDGGVYIQVESIGLTRGVPVLFTWVVNPYLQSLPRKYLTDLLNDTRKALVPEQSVSARGDGSP